jgi:ribonuclease VapC
VSVGAPIPTILDASALLAFVHREPGLDRVQSALPTSAMSSVNWSEVVQKVAARGLPVSGLRHDLHALGLNLLSFTAEDAEEAAHLWSLTRSLGLSLGDRACLALGRRLGGPILTADRAWQTLALGLDIRVIR